MDQADRMLQSMRQKLSRNSTMTWIDNLTIQCKGVILQLTQDFPVKKSSADVVTIFKDPSFVHDYVQCLEGIDARNVVEVGVYHGGSAIFFWNLLSPYRMCCIELNPAAKHLTGYIERFGLQDAISTHFKTNQADKPRLREIMDARFGGTALDLVIDDASHLYTPSLATFEVMFPRLRPGGLYFLEDWRVHLTINNYGREPFGEEPPLHRLVHELLNLSMVHRDIISKVACHHNFVIFERGEAVLDAKDWDIRALLDSASALIEH